MMNNHKNLNSQKDHLLNLIAQLAQKVAADELERPDVLELQVEKWLKGEGGDLGDRLETDTPQRVLEELPAMIWRVGADRQCSFVNPAWLAFTGRTLAQELGSGWEKGVHPEDRRRRRQIFARAFSGQQPFNLEFRLRHYTGDYRWVRDFGRPITDATGAFAGYIGISIDLTELKEKDRALTESEARFEALFDFDPDAVIVVGPRGRIQLANRQALNMFGYSPNELYGQTVEMLMPSSFRRRHEKHLLGYMRAPRVRPMGAHLDLVAQRKDGSLFPVDITLGPLESEEGTVVLATIRDITDRKRMEAELSEVNRRLIDSAEVERLQLAQELHDGPLQDLYSLTYQLSGLQSMISSARGKELAASIARQTQQVASSVRTVLGELRPPALAPYGLERAIRSHARSEAERHPEVTVELDLASDGNALSERVRLVLFRIYQQAMANALRHADASRIEITFRLNEGEVELEVKDNGRGFVMPERTIELVRKGHYGLAGSMERAESIGGRFEVNSQPEAGTAVRVVIPRLEELQVAPMERLSNVYSP